MLGLKGNEKPQRLLGSSYIDTCPSIGATRLKPRFGRTFKRDFQAKVKAKQAAHRVPEFGPFNNPVKVYITKLTGTPTSFPLIPPLVGDVATA